MNTKCILIAVIISFGTFFTDNCEATSKYNFNKYNNTIKYKDRIYNKYLQQEINTIFNTFVKQTSNLSKEMNSIINYFKNNSQPIQYNGNNLEYINENYITFSNIYHEFAKSLYLLVKKEYKQKNEGVDENYIHAINEYLTENWKNNKKIMKTFNKEIIRYIQSIPDKDNDSINNFTSIKKIISYYDVTYRLESVLNSFITELKSIGNTHDYKRQMYYEYSKFIKNINTTLKYIETTNDTIDDAELQSHMINTLLNKSYYWKMLLERRIPEINAILKQIDNSFPKDKAVEYFYKYYPLLNINDIVTKYKNNI